MAIFTKKSNPRIEVESIQRGLEITPPPPIAVKTAQRGYGIGDAIQLMRSLPVDQNVDLVVQVIRATLASMNVRVHDIIEDAHCKEKATEAGIAALHGQVADLERELDERRREILGLEADLEETMAVKERLQLAETIANVLPPPPPAESTTNGQLGSYTHQP